MKQDYLLFVVLLGATILGMRSGIADGVLAFGNAKGGPTFGWAAGFSKGSADAATHALNECRNIKKYNCEVFATFHDQCFAISSNGTATQWNSPIGFWLVDCEGFGHSSAGGHRSMRVHGGRRSAAMRDPKVRLRGLSEIATNAPRAFAASVD